MALILILLSVSMALALVLWLLLRLFFWLQRPEDLEPDTLHALLPFAAHSRWVTIDGIQLHYVDQGQGPVLVLIHGYGASAYSWREVLEPLSQSFRVIALDLKGFGLSDKTVGDYRPEAQAELVVHFLQALRVDHAVFIGNSMGGSIALAIALRYPELVRGLVLVDSAAFTLNRRLRTIRRLTALPGVGEVVGACLLMNSRLLVRWFLYRCYYDPMRITPMQRAVYHAPLATRRGGTAAQVAGLNFDLSAIVAQLHRVTHPTLLIWGEADRIVPLENAYHLRDRLPNTRLIVLERCGHIPQEENPRQFLDAITPFLHELTEKPEPLPTPKSQRA